MAKKVTKKAAGPASRGSSAKKPGKTASRARKPARPRASAGSKKRKTASELTAADALAGLLESPLVAEVIAAGAAAALATLTQQALSKKSRGGTSEALKQAAKAAASAMGARLTTEIEEILESAKKASDEAR